MDFAYLYTSFDGRINRKPYWLAGILLAVIMMVVTFVLAFVIGFSLGVGFGFHLLILILQLAVLYPSAALMVKRLHDRNKPGYYAAFLLGLIVLKSLTDLVGLTGDPLSSNILDYILGIATFVIAIWFLIELGFLRGTQGPNQYGPDPLGSP
jgi:uncharacterized membrane protein YhaH (DUF805 family)